VAIAAASSVTAIIPCLDEEEAIGPVVDRLARYGLAEIIVVDGGSRDRTVEVARAAGARVVHAPRRGYGLALRAGLAASSPLSRIVLFLDGDGSDPLEAIPALLQPIEQDFADFVMGSRLRGARELGSLAPAQILAGRLAGLLIWLRYGVRFTDMSPLRAIRRDVLDGLGMHAESYGWNLEMQMRVAAQRRRILELPVGQKRRVGGRSKVSGSWWTALRATWVLASTFVRLALAPSAAQGASRRRRGS
jgi:glycosyltransferase involved in cell wall biosynthesis